MPGYNKKTIQYLISLYPEATHLILTTGYQDVLQVLGFKRTSSGFLKKVEAKLKAFIYEKRPASKVEIRILNTLEAIPEYHQLSKNSNNKVIMAAHFTC